LYLKAEVIVSRRKTVVDLRFPIVRKVIVQMYYRHPEDVGEHSGMHWASKSEGTMGFRKLSNGPHNLCCSPNDRVIKSRMASCDGRAASMGKMHSEFLL
jgi:hypothetical protein